MNDSIIFINDKLNKQKLDTVHDIDDVIIIINILREFK